MQKHPEASDRKRGDACAKKRDRPDKRRNLILFQQRPAECQHLANWWRTPMRPSFDDSLANPSSGSSRLFHHQLMTITLDLDKLPKATNTSLKIYIPNTLLEL